MERPIRVGKHNSRYTAITEVRQLKHSLSVFLIIVASLCSTSAHAQTRSSQKPKIAPVSPAQSAEWDKINRRFKEHHQRFSGLGWTLIHNYESKVEMDRALKLMLSIARTIGRKDPRLVDKFNGPRGFKEQLLTMMKSKDATVSGYAANILAIIGDESYAPHIAALLERDLGATDHKSEFTTVRAAAVMALATLNATQYAGRISKMLKSQNMYDRTSAAYALGQFKASQYAADVASLLKLDLLGSTDEVASIAALFEMGVAANYKADFAEVLNNDDLGERSVAAAYALARLRAREHANALATMLKDKFKKGEAAKALGIMGATEYADEIAEILGDEGSFNREDAALALGIMGAKEKTGALVPLLGHQEFWVRLGAAKALVLLGATEHREAILKVLGKQKAGPYIDAEDLHRLVAEEAQALNSRFETSLAAIKRGRRTAERSQP